MKYIHQNALQEIQSLLYNNKCAFYSEEISDKKCSDCSVWELLTLQMSFVLNDSN